MDVFSSSCIVGQFLLSIFIINFDLQFILILHNAYSLSFCPLRVEIEVCKEIHVIFFGHEITTTLWI